MKNAERRSTKKEKSDAEKIDEKLISNGTGEFNADKEKMTPARDAAIAKPRLVAWAVAASRRKKNPDTAPRENKTMEVINKNDIIISKKYEFLFTVAKITSLANHLHNNF